MAVVWVWMEGRKVPMLDCASLVLFKSFFDRTKDWGDIEAVAIATPEDIEDGDPRGWESWSERTMGSLQTTRGLYPGRKPGLTGVVRPPQAAGSSETAWLATIVPSGSHWRLTSARRVQVSAGRIESASQGRSTKLK